MSNYVHLLLTPQNEDSLAKTIQSLGRCYAQYLNQPHHRTGIIWEGRHRSSLIGPDYFLWCQRYIELNPVRSGCEFNPQDFPWTSFAMHIGGRWESLLVDQPHFWRLGNTPF